MEVNFGRAKKNGNVNCARMGREHWRNCREMETTNASLEEILSEEGGKEAVKWLKRIERRKKDKERQEEENEKIRQV